MRGLRGLPRESILLVSALLLIVVCIAGATPALAIPAFARKYRTSCQTCHVAFPNLTPFGEAFRLNGFRFPEGTDSAVSKDQPVRLGAEGYKKLWPRSVWPGEIPGLPPVSLVVESEIAYDKEEKTTSFDGLGGEVAILTGGTLGDNFSFYGEVEAAREDGEASIDLERVYLVAHPLSSPVMQVKIGAFEPGVFLVSNHRRLTDQRYFALGGTVGDNGWAFEPYQQGIEFFGVVSHRVLYNAGYVEGSGNESNNPKDAYARVAYKFGGLRLDGTTPGGAEAALPANPKPWSEKALTISAFTYRGRPTLSETDVTLVNDPATNIVTPVETTIEQSDHFRVTGGDLAWQYLDVTLRAGLSNRTDRMPFLADPAITDVKTKNRFFEVSWVAYPWLVPAARWEKIEVAGEKTERISVTLEALIRANVRGFLAADRIREPGDDYRLEEVVGGVVVGF